MARISPSSVRVPHRYGVVGLGLIGGSFAKAFHAAGNEVYAWNRTGATLELAQVETVDGELNSNTISRCELIVLCSYTDSCIAWLEEHAGDICPGAIVIDACGIKRPVCNVAFELARTKDWDFCGAHPMAGSQFSGFAHARANLFEGAPLVLCPAPYMDDFSRADMLERIKSLLACCHFGTLTLTTAENHDRMIAYTSQLPHAIANAYVKSPTNQERLGFSGGSYRDLTRVAHMNAAMWCDLFLQNADRLSFELDSMIEALLELRRAIDDRDEATLIELLRQGDAIQRAQEALSAQSTQGASSQHNALSYKDSQSNAERNALSHEYMRAEQEEHAGQEGLL